MCWFCKRETSKHESEIADLREQIQSLRACLDARMEVLQIEDGDTPVFMHPREFGINAELFIDAVKRRFPGTTPILLEDGVRIGFIREVKTL